MAKLEEEQVKVANGMVRKGASIRQVAAQLGVSEGALRYRLKRRRSGPVVDGRSRQPSALDGYEAAVDAILERLEDGRRSGEGRPSQARQVFEVLAREYGYAGSYRAVVRHLRRRFGVPKMRALRRVETPPGVQAQHDWFEGKVRLEGRRQTLYFLDALQAALDERADSLMDRLKCSATGTLVRDAFSAERHVLQPRPALGAPFDIVVSRRVHRDCLVSFEGRRYSAPFAWVGRDVEIWGLHNRVVIRAQGQEIARHPRHTPGAARARPCALRGRVYGPGHPADARIRAFPCSRRKRCHGVASSGASGWSRTRHPVTLQ